MKLKNSRHTKQKLGRTKKKKRKKNQYTPVLRIDGIFQNRKLLFLQDYSSSHAAFGAPPDWSPGRPQPHLGAVTQSADSAPETSALIATAQGSHTSCRVLWAGWQVTSSLFDSIFAPRRMFPVSEFPLHRYVLLLDGRYSRWLIPSTIAGASQLFRSLLTWGIL